MLDIRVYIDLHLHTQELRKFYADDDQHNIHHRHLNNLLCKFARNKFDERNIFTVGFPSHEWGFITFMWFIKTIH